MRDAHLRENVPGLGDVFSSGNAANEIKTRHCSLFLTLNIRNRKMDSQPLKPTAHPSGSLLYEQESLRRRQSGAWNPQAHSSCLFGPLNHPTLLLTYADGGERVGYYRYLCNLAPGE